MTLPNDVEYDFRCQACGGEYFGDREPRQRWCHDCAQELLPQALTACKTLLAIVVSEFNCGGERECLKRYQSQVDAARAAIAVVEGGK